MGFQAKLSSIPHQRGGQGRAEALGRAIGGGRGAVLPLAAARGVEIPPDVVDLLAVIHRDGLRAYLPWPLQFRQPAQPCSSLGNLHSHAFRVMLP